MFQKFRQNRVMRPYRNMDIVCGICPEEALALHTLAKQAVKSGSSLFVEVGSWKGHSSAIIASVIKDKGLLHCIDHWKGSEQTQLLDEAKERDIYSVWVDNMTHLKVINFIVPHSDDSKKAVSSFGDNTIDFLFIDGDHRYEQFKKDLKRWLPKVKMGGIICGHDCEVKYTESYPELQERIDSGLGEDFDGNYHCGIIKGLYDIFGDNYILVDGSKIWAKEK